MGDALGHNAEKVLRSGITTLYPSRNPDVDDELRFTVTRNGLNRWDIHDDDYENDPIKITRQYLEEPDFDICNWYLGRRRAQREAAEAPDDSDNPPPGSPKAPDNSGSDDSTTGIYSSFEITRPRMENPRNERDPDPEGNQSPTRQHTEPGDTDLTDQISPEQLWELGAQGTVERSANPIGDVLGTTLLAILEGSGPYPGDETQQGPKENLWFTLEDFQDSFYVVKDNDRNEEIYFHIQSLTKTCRPAVRYAKQCADKLEISVPPQWQLAPQVEMGPALETAMERAVEKGRPYRNEWDYEGRLEPRCRVIVDPLSSGGTFIVKDLIDKRSWRISRSLLTTVDFDPAKWYQEKLLQPPDQSPNDQEPVHPPVTFERQRLRDMVQEHARDNESLSPPPYVNPDLHTGVAPLLYLSELVQQDSEEEETPVLLNGMQVARGTLPAMQRNAASVKDPSRTVPKPVVITVKINGHPARALIDSGSLGDFMSSTLADQLKLTKEALEVPLGLQLAVQGSRSKINSRTKASLQYQDIDEERYFDIVNLSYYDIILGTPWLFQHSVCLGLNPARVLIGNDASLPISGKSVTSIASRAMDTSQAAIERAREELINYAEPLCKAASETGLPPFRAINHKIPLIDEKKVYPWRPSRCPEVFREQWAEKRDAYLRTGRWKITSSGNTVPMLLIAKPRVPGGPLLLRTVVDLRARNDNTYKQTSPLPDPEGILRRAAAHTFRSLMDGKDAYEQIRIEPDHVHRTAVTTPDGNMVSLVIQIGDCNAPATYQALMNHIFSGYIGRIMDIYLDDIVVYSNSLDEHVSYVKLIIDILKREKLYLSKNKLHFLKKELKILGRIITDDGIRMDPDKVDNVLSWKTPTNRDLLQGFLGSVGYLADDIPGVRIPMAVLHGLTGDAVSFRWGFTEQRAFEDVKTLVQAAREHHRVPLNYDKSAPPVWMVTDGCATGVAGLVSQGDDWRTARIAAFYSAKLNPAQQNYPVHEIEMLAGVETMLRHRDILQGANFKWITDHKGLIHLLRQKNLSGRQARWCEKISEFNFEIVYVPGTENVVADALSRMYSNDSNGTVRAPSEYTYFDVINDDIEVDSTLDATVPILAGIDATLVAQRKPRTAPKEPSPAETGRPETSKEFAA